MKGLKVAGFLLMVAGWLIVLSAIALLHTLAAQTAFALTGVGVEVLGFVLAARDLMPKRRAKSDL